MSSLLLQNIVNIWQNYKLIIIIGVSLFILLLVCIFFREKTTTTQNYTYQPFPKLQDTWPYIYMMTPPPPLLSKSSQHSSFSVSPRYDNMKYYNKPGSFISKGEAICRQVLEKTFHRPFPKTRPEFLINPVTGKRLELDCYNNDLKLGVEYSGKQHFQPVEYFQSNKDQYFNQKYRDEIKRQLCRENGVTLIEIDYSVSLDNIENELLKQLTTLQYI